MSRRRESPQWGQGASTHLVPPGQTEEQNQVLFLGCQVPCDLVRGLETGRLCQTRSTRPSGLSEHLARDEGHGEGSLRHRSRRTCFL